MIELRSVTVHGWSPDGRFLPAPGMGAEWKLLAVDLRTGTVSSIVVDGRSVAVAATS